MKKSRLAIRNVVEFHTLLLAASAGLWSCGSSKSDDSGTTPTTSTPTAEEGLALTKTYCTSCHGDTTQSGNVKLTTQAEAKTNAAKSISQMNLSTMPPKTSTQPTADEKAKLLAYFKSL
jgi:uncharacterized membrane protein